jgi:hypothetical protein
MYLLAIVTTTILVVFTYLYFYKLPASFTVKKRRLDITGKTHRFVDITDHLVDHCAVDDA